MIYISGKYPIGLSIYHVQNLDSFSYSLSECISTSYQNSNAYGLSVTCYGNGLSRQIDCVNDAEQSISFTENLTIPLESPTGYYKVYINDYRINCLAIIKDSEGKTLSIEEINCMTIENNLSIVVERKIPISYPTC